MQLNQVFKPTLTSIPDYMSRDVAITAARGAYAAVQGVQAFGRLTSTRGWRIAGKATGYASAAASWIDFSRRRNVSSFLRAGTNTGLAVMRVHPLVNIGMFALDYSGRMDRMFDAVEARFSAPAEVPAEEEQSPEPAKKTRARKSTAKSKGRSGKTD